jgi:AcrR family transcriptional regulator
LKRDILAGALACFNDYGIEAATIDQIRVRCETSVGNIYHHFGSKEGIIAALFFAAMDDQCRVRDVSLRQAATLEQGVRAQVTSYVMWVVAEPELARFQFQSRSFLINEAAVKALKERNRERNQQFKEWLVGIPASNLIAGVASELLPSLIIGQSESYCRAWLAGRVKTPPDQFITALTEAAWASVLACGNLAEKEQHHDLNSDR